MIGGEGKTSSTVFTFIISGKAVHSMYFQLTSPLYISVCLLACFLSCFSPVLVASPEIFDLADRTQDLASIPSDSLGELMCLHSFSLHLQCFNCFDVLILFGRDITNSECFHNNIKTNNSFRDLFPLTSC